MATKTVVLPSDLQKKKDELSRIQALRGSGVAVTGQQAQDAVKAATLKSPSVIGQTKSQILPSVTPTQKTTSQVTSTNTTTSYPLVYKDGKEYENRNGTLVATGNEAKKTLEESIAKQTQQSFGEAPLTEEQKKQELLSQQQQDKDLLDMQIENAKLSTKQALTDAERTGTANKSAFQSSIVSAPGMLQASTEQPLIAGISGVMQENLNKMQREADLQTAKAQSLKDELAIAQRDKRYEYAAELQKKIYQAEASAEQAKKESLQAQKDATSETLKLTQQKSANFINATNALDSFSVSALGEMSANDVVNFYKNAGSEISPLQAEGIVSSYKKIAELSKSKNADDQAKAQLERRQLMVNIKNAQQTESDKTVQNYRELKTALDNGQISQEYFDLKTGAKDKAQKFTFHSADGIAYAFDPSTGTARVLNQSEAPSYGNIGNGMITQQYGSKSPLSSDNVKLQNGVIGTPGIDFDGNIGDPVQSFAAGTVTQVTEAGGYGNQVVITDSEGNQHMYSHLRDLDVPVSVGDTVTAGQLLGFMGNTGNVVKSATGDGSHLDYRVKSQNLVNGSPWVDPNKFISKKGQGISQEEIIAITKEAFGKTASEGERKAVEKLINESYSKGITDRQVIIDNLKGFKIEDPKNASFATNIYAKVLNEEDPSVKASTISRLINAGDYNTAISNVEQYKLNKIDPKLEATNTYSRMTKGSENLAKELPEIDEDLLGPFDGRVFQVEKGFFTSDKEFNKTQKFAGELAQLVAAMRNRLSGTAVTESEKAFLEPLIPDIGDQPNIILAKLQQIQEGSFSELNNYRSTAGLPELQNYEQVRNYSSRKSLYEKEEPIYGPVQKNDSLNLGVQTDTLGIL